ncbi:MAG: hypothetical protein AAGF90_03660 [Pseudomonadota bacterium]
MKTATRTAPDAEAEPFRFALLCHQRSGSNALSAILDADPRVGLYGQLFNPFLEYRIRNLRHGFGGYKRHPEALRHFGLKPPLRPRLEAAGLRLWPAVTRLDRQTRAFWRKYPRGRPLGAVGFKLHDYQLVDEELAGLARDHVDGVVMLWRRNLLKAAVSWAYAIKTDVWSSRDDRGRGQPVHRLDPDEIGWFIEKTAAEVARWRGLLKGANALELTYEDHVAPRKLDALYGFLGLGEPGSLEFRTKRLSRPDYAHVSNAAELDERFGSDETGRLFAD